MRQFAERREWPSPGAETADGKPVYCIRCPIDARYQMEDGRMRKAYRRRAVVTAVDVTNGGRLPVAYCKRHIPDDMYGAGVGNGILTCHGCGRPTRDHSLLDSCLAKR